MVAGAYVNVLPPSQMETVTGYAVSREDCEDYSGVCRRIN